MKWNDKPVLILMKSLKWFMGYGMSIVFVVFAPNMHQVQGWIQEFSRGGGAYTFLRRKAAAPGPPHIQSGALPLQK